ncbi:ROK family transcriptional regulator [Nonomuraea turkmeniaca]|uniref:ROK family transcriptional regulator n=1 Tax=Nonomuraea turkmeniaca TaxID=103838 RepID=A0A5S4EY32_9ACTN|nr:ROK family transcriptional regulator [Nonomuraea turkmeniaca]TMR08572.1 ROK family transcriptional regulator [Nonomuraea turkmeniaca]
MNGATTSGELRSHNRVRLLRAVHDCGAARTRSQLTRDLRLARGTASVLVAGLVADELLHEEPAPEHARGRPTQVPGPHPRGPVALAVDVREDAWELAACELGGRVTVLAVRPHDGTPEDTLGPLGEAVAAERERLGHRVIGVGVALAGPVGHGGLVDIAHLSWRSVDVPHLLGLAPPLAHGTPSTEAGDGRGPAGGRMPLVVGNDTAFAALAEARRGRLQGVRVGLHLHVDFDLGGVLVVDGRPLGGASGTGAEFGHMPLTGGDRLCMCGAIGCWGMDVGANALLRHVGLAYGGGRGREQAEHVLATSREAVAANARALGRGIAALVNAHDPEAVTLSGHGVELFERAGDALMAACEPGLMAIRRDRPPRVEGSALGWRGSLLGAMESVFDAFLTPEGLDQWRAHHPDQGRDTPDGRNVMNSTLPVESPP